MFLRKNIIYILVRFHEWGKLKKPKRSLSRRNSSLPMWNTDMFTIIINTIKTTIDFIAFFSMSIVIQTPIVP